MFAESFREVFWKMPPRYYCIDAAVTIAISAEIEYFTAAPHRHLARINPASAA